MSALKAAKMINAQTMAWEQQRLLDRQVRDEQLTVLSSIQLRFHENIPEFKIC